MKITWAQEVSEPDPSQTSKEPTPKGPKGPEPNAPPPKAASNTHVSIAHFVHGKRFFKKRTFFHAQVRSFDQAQWVGGEGGGSL